MNIEPLGLIEGAGEAVEDEAAADVGLGEAVGDHLVDEIVGDELALVHQALGGSAELGSAGDVIAQEVAGGDLRNSILSHQELGLSAFADAGGSQKEDRPGQEVGVCRGRFCMCC